MSARPILPASSSEFALPPAHHGANTFSATCTNAPFPSPSEEISSLMMLRFRRPSLLAPVRPASLQDFRSQSPLATTSFTLPLSRRYSTSIKDDGGEESESDREKMWTDSPPSGDSGATTPSLASDPSEKSSMRGDSDVSLKSAARPSTPPLRVPDKLAADPMNESTMQTKHRRLSQPVSTLLARDCSFHANTLRPI